MIRTSFFTVILGLLTIAPAFAQESVGLRAGMHDQYARIVFQWPSAVSYSAERPSSGVLKISFDRAAQLDQSGFSPEQTGGVIGDVKIMSAQGQKLQVEISVSPDATYRHFVIGNRVVFDVTGKVTAPAVKNDPVVPQAEKSAEQVIQPVKDQPVLQITEQQEVAPAPHTITLRSTEITGMAAFIRDNTLWLVIDRTDIKSMPELSGPSRDKFSEFRTVNLPNGIAYTLSLPRMQGMKIYGEGGGLVWRLVLTPEKRALTPAPLERIFSGSAGAALLGLKAIGKIVDVPDTENGDIVRVVTVTSANEFAGPYQSFVDFNILESPIGVAVVSKTDNLNVRTLPMGVEVGRPGPGLSISRIKDIARHAVEQKMSEITELAASKSDKPPAANEAKAEILVPAEFLRIYDFDRWRMGSGEHLDENQRIILAGSGNKDKSGLVQNLLALAKLNIAHDRGQEAIGYINYASELLPEITEGAEFKALRGAAYALAGKPELGLQDFSDPTLKNYNELDYWRAYVLANLEDWQQAIAVMPRDVAVLNAYPQPLLERIGLKLAEVALRGGGIETAKAILSAVGRDRKSMRPWTKAALDYLDGEAERQKKDFKKAAGIWGPLSVGDDQLHRAKAGLALTMMELQSGSVKLEQAIDRLEGLRYTWRGDEIEARINFVLGKLYLERNEYVKAFSIMREAAGLNPDSEIGHEITAYIREAFRNLIMDDKDLKPTEAAIVFEEFPELVPPGEDGDKLLQRLSDRLLEADLLGRSSSILQKQVDTRLQGADRARIATQLAAIYLLDNAPENALKALDVAQQIYATQKDDVSAAQLYKIMLMRAKALSMMKRVSEALDLLNKADPAPEVSRLRADIAWQSGSWEEAAESLQNLIIDENIDTERPLTDDQASLILNRAVALNLSGNRVALMNTRQRYEAAMNRTSRARLFDVITRPRQGAFLSDRETLQSIVSEVNIFKGFLENYRSSAPADDSQPAAQSLPK